MTAVKYTPFGHHLPKIHILMVLTFNMMLVCIKNYVQMQPTTKIINQLFTRRYASGAIYLLIIFEDVGIFNNNCNRKVKQKMR